MTTCFYIK